MRREILHGADFCAVTEDGRLVEYIPLEDGAGRRSSCGVYTGRSVPAVRRYPDRQD